jgi:hypothetical protein
MGGDHLMLSSPASRAWPGPREGWEPQAFKRSSPAPTTLFKTLSDFVTGVVEEELTKGRSPAFRQPVLPATTGFLVTGSIYRGGLADFSFDDSAFRRFVEGMRHTIAPVIQQALDDIYRTHEGKPVDEVKLALQHRWATNGEGWELTDPHLSAYAEVISEGRRIEMQVGPSQRQLLT